MTGGPRGRPVGTGPSGRREPGEPVRLADAATVLVLALSLSIACVSCRNDVSGDAEADPVAEGTATAAAPPVADSGRLQVGDSAELAWWSVGAGPPLVVVHGGPGLDHRYLRDGLSRLATGRRVVFYDQRGVGSSRAALDSAVVNWSAYLADLDALVDSVAGGPVAVVAHSWGALLALEWVRTRPERARALVLVSPVEPGRRWADAQAERAAERRSPGDREAMASLARTEAFARRDPEAVSEMMRLAYRGTLPDPADLEALDLDLVERTARDGGRVAELVMAGRVGADGWDALPDVGVPVLVVHGDEDPVPPAMARALARAVPEGVLVLLRGVGHFAWVEAPRRFEASVASFLDRIERASPAGRPPTSGPDGGTSP